MKHKYIFCNFTFYDRTGIERFLEEMAANGWMFEKAGSVFWRFRAIDPKKIHFAVTYFPSASVYDPEPSESQLMFRDFCEHTGWRHLASLSQMQIYCNEAEAPVPIETDAVIECENIHKSAKKSYLPGYYTILFSGLLLLLMTVWQILSSPAEHLANTITTMLSLLGFCQTAMGGAELIQYYLWYNKAIRSAVESGIFVETQDRHIFRTVLPVLELLLLAAMFFTLLSERSPYSSFHAGRLLAVVFSYIAAGIASVLVLTVLLKKLKTPAKINRTVTSIAFILTGSIVLTSLTSFIIHDVNHGNLLRVSAGTYEYNGNLFSIYNDELPLYIEDLIESDYRQYNTKLKVSSSPFASSTKAFQQPRLDASDEPRFEYTVFDVKVPFLRSLCLNDFLNEYNTNLRDESGGIALRTYRKSDAAVWNADLAYQLKSLSNNHSYDVYLLVFGSRIIKFEADFHIDDNMKKVITEKLSEY